MKKYLFASILLVSTAFSMIASGCSEKSSELSVSESTSSVQTNVTRFNDYIAETTVSSTGAVTTAPQKFTSRMTCTTIEPNTSVISKLLSSMTLEEKIYQMFIVTPEALTGFEGSVTQAGSMTQSAYMSTPVGGLIYFSQNLETWQQTSEMLHNTQNMAQKLNNDIGVFLAVDEEGGDVARVGNNFRVYNSYDMEYYGSREDYTTVYNLGNTIGVTLKDLGFNLDFAPVADVNINPDNELGNRIFSDDPMIVSEMTYNFVRGLKDTGVASTLKHFPGLGAGDGNTHNSSVYIDRQYEDLFYNEFMAFLGGINADSDFVMVGHQITAASGDNLPGDLSPIVVNQWLKTDLGFSGLVITDSQSMGAITDNYTPGQAAVMAVKAGVDIILMPNDLANAVQGIQDALKSGELTEERINESVTKILTKKLTLGLLDVEIPQTSTTTLYQ